jgi:ATP-dependent RNA helicase DDX46/PRP5
MDDSVETKRQLEMLGDMPAVDMTMADGEATIGDLEVDDDDEDANRIDAESKAKARAKAENSMDVDDDDDVDPLDAFMAGVKDEVKKVNAEDLKKMVGSGRLPEQGDDRMNEAGADDDGDVEVEDELDATDLNPEDILALAAKKARKKDLAAVDHNKIKYEPFRKEFYIPPPEVAAMTDEEAELLRLELDSIKIRGVDCPRPVTKWSHFGLHASVYVVFLFFRLAIPSMLIVFSAWM